jgi:hypothetical protein
MATEDRHARFEFEAPAGETVDVSAALHALGITEHASPMPHRLPLVGAKLVLTFDMGESEQQ